MTNFLLRIITAVFLVLGVGFIFLCLPKIAFTLLILAILVEILFLEWPKLAGKNIWVWLFAVIYLVLPVYLLILLNHAEQFKLLGLLLIVVPAFDMGAYLVGKTIGKHKLCPSISPNKTWEGVLGGFIGVLGVLLITTTCDFTNLGLIFEKFNTGIMHNPCTGFPLSLLDMAHTVVQGLCPCMVSDFVEIVSNPARTILLGLIITLLATLGDLFESWLKRRAGVKDSGSLLPGHGGFLDRIDGIIFVTYFFYFFKNFVLSLI